MRCENCGRDSSGNFCSNCGASLGAVACPSCGHSPPAGARFCNKCGSAMSTAAKAAPSAPRPPARPAPATGGSNNTLWVVGGVVLAGVMLVALYPIFSPQDVNITPPAQQTDAPLGRSGVDLTQMTPREAADRLWNRVVAAAEAGDQAQAAQFLPMAISAYQMIEGLDADGHYHLAMLHLQGSDAETALEVAETALGDYPEHLLNLAAAAEASLAMADTVAARGFYQRMLDAWDTELAKGREDYEGHAGIQPILRQSAEDLLGG